MATKIRHEDEVIVLTGKDKGKRGKVTLIMETGKAMVASINLVKKHQKPVAARKQPGGIIEKEAAIDLSNLAIFNATTRKRDRVGFKIKNGKKIRFFKSNGEIIR